MSTRYAMLATMLGAVWLSHGAAAQRAAAPTGLIGTWTLLSTEQHVESGSTPTRVTNPRGLLIYDSAGHALEIVTHAGRAPYAANQATPAEAHVTFDNYSGFWGGYQLDERAGQIVYRPEGA